jgi:hypothetical protein
MDRAVGYQVAPSAIGGAVLPAGTVLVVQRLGATALEPMTLALALVPAVGYGLLARLPACPPARPATATPALGTSAADR